MSLSSTNRSPSELTLLLSVLLLGGCSGPPANESEAELVERARGIHERVITMDTHNDISASHFTAERN